MRGIFELSCGNLQIRNGIFIRKEDLMKRKQFVSVLILAGAFMATNPGLTLAQSVGGSQSERTGAGDQTPMPKGGYSGEEGKAGKASKNQSKTNKDTSIGGSRSERTGGGDQTPMPKGGYTDESKAGKKATKGQSQTKKDTSVGGSQSERSGGEDQTPMPKGRQ
jgi:hypothetical protein